jgi:hypothetical protein
MEKLLTQEQLDSLKIMIEDYRKIYTKASRIGKQIEDLQSEMVKVSMEMTNISSQESNFYKEIATTLDIPVEEAQKLILEELQKNMNESQN